MPEDGGPAASRYARIKQILDDAAGDSRADYMGHGRFWHLPLAELKELVLYGVRLIAPAAGAPTAPATREADGCCAPKAGAESEAAPVAARAETRQAGRGAASGLVKGLRGEFPFDGSQFPRLPWGGKSVAAADITLIEGWIDDGCPETDTPAAIADTQSHALATGAVPYAVMADRTNDFRGGLGEVMHRQNVEHLTPSELADLRQAIAELQHLNQWPRDVRSYNAWAQLHGNECPHGWSIFLPWHRMYLWRFEQALRDRVKTVMLPYWDWTGSSPEQIASGYIPEPYRCWVTDSMLAALQGRVAAGTIKALAAVEGTTFSSITKLWQAAGAVPQNEQAAIVEQLKLVNPLWWDLRYPGEFGAGSLQDFHHHYPTADDITRMLAVKTWKQFGGGMDVNQSFGVIDMLPHNTMHIWIGGFPSPGVNGDMAANLTAAFDPIFWAHHANVDRIWALWQDAHPGVDPTDLSDVLPGVDATVAVSLNLHELGYDYAADSYLFPMSPETEITKFRSDVAGVREQVLGNHKRAEVVLHRVRQPEQSFIVRVFLNLPEADTGTSIVDNPHYAGFFALFGHGPCIGGPGHCEPRPMPRRPFDTRPPHHNEPWTVRFDVTDTVRTLVAQGATDVQVNLVVLSPDGTDDRAMLRMHGVSIAFQD